ncbi:hypothetical protein CR513_15173, partial [Mucuna pruriens]
MTNIFSDLLQDCMEVFMDDFTVYADSFDACLENLSKVLRRCSCLKLIAGKLRSRWDEPFVITNVFPYGVVELKDEHTNSTFQVNGHKIKPFHEGPVPPKGDMETILLMEPAPPDLSFSPSFSFSFLSVTFAQAESTPALMPSRSDPDRLRSLQAKARKSMITLNLMGQRSIGIVLEVSHDQVWRRYQEAK